MPELPHDHDAPLIGDRGVRYDTTMLDIAAIGPIERQAELQAIDERERAARERSRAGRWVWGGLGVVFWLAIAVTAVVFGLALWVRRTFGVVTIEQLISNLPGGAEGAGGDGLVTEAVVQGVAIPLAIVGLFAFLVEMSRRSLREYGVWRGARAWGMRALGLVVAVAVPLAGGAFVSQSIGVQEYVQAALSTSDMGEYYVHPPRPSAYSGSVLGGGAQGRAASADGAAASADGAAAPRGGAASAASRDDRSEKPLNLVFIYLESVEDAFADDEVFETDMLAPLERATRGWAQIDGLQQYYGGGWTMSGVVATQCGVPLRSTFGGFQNDESGQIASADSGYMPAATCLGDVLQANGYRSVFMGGADATFASKGTFLSQHGYDEIFDLSTWKAEGETELRPDWGLSDRRLFARAQEEAARLHAADEPFNLTLLTLDTHESPYLYDGCEQTTDELLESITRCSMQQVADFVDFLDEEGMLDDTAVVIMGDHLKMISETAGFWDELRDREDRTIFNRVWAPGDVSFARGGVDQFSVYPTILELLGLPLPERRAGIGVSALASADEVGPGSPLELSPGEYTDLVRSRSADFYSGLWGRTGETSLAAE